VEVQDINGEIEHINDLIQFDPKRIEQLNDRIAEGYKLQKKHGVHSTAELLLIKYKLDEKLQAVLNIDEAIASKEKVVKQLIQEAENWQRNFLRIEISKQNHYRIKSINYCTR
jgi:DNA repair protein RecN (Recombination protein N)